jgi:hypothetical protein
MNVARLRTFPTIAREEIVNAHDVEVSLIWYAL